MSGGRFALLTGLLLSLVTSAPAIGPHEVAVLVNAESEASRTIARTYVKLRNIPFANLIPLRLPERINPNDLTPEEFTRYVWEPANALLRERGIDDHILAWVYSVDMPIRVTTEPVVSIHGATFYRNDFSALPQVVSGRYESPLHAGPNRPDRPGYRSQSLDVARDALGADMPLPAMSLGYTGERGHSTNDVLAMLRRGVESDGTRPTAPVYYVTSEDIRSTCRAWQYAGAVAELKKRGIVAEITDVFPAGKPALGIMVGAAKVPAANASIVPGGMGEHLTSSAAVFESDDQTKLTEWISAGAVAAAGTVTEPLSMWMKFPHARFFVHYAAGCTVLESFYQSVCSPAQLLMVGDPLAQPWKPEAELTVSGVMAVVKGPVEWSARVEGEGLYRHVDYLLDGKLIGSGAAFTFDPRGYEPGKHQLHVVARQTGLVRSQVVKSFMLEIKHP